MIMYLKVILSMWKRQSYYIIVALHVVSFACYCSENCTSHDQGKIPGELSTRSMHKITDSHAAAQSQSASLRPCVKIPQHMSLMYQRDSGRENKLRYCYLEEIKWRIRKTFVARYILRKKSLIFGLPLSLNPSTDKTT